MADVVTPDASRELTEEQRCAVEELFALADTREFRVALLHGVTGSGKTEIYLRLADRMCRTGRQVLLWCRKSRLRRPSRPSFAARSAPASPFSTARCRTASVTIIGTASAGARSTRRRHAIGSLCAARSPRPDHRGRGARQLVQAGGDAALSRPRRGGRAREPRARAGRARLGDAVDGELSERRGGKYARIALERRVLDRPLAAVRIVNMRTEYADAGPDVVISRDLAGAIAERWDDVSRCSCS